MNRTRAAYVCIFAGLAAMLAGAIFGAVAVNVRALPYWPTHASMGVTVALSALAIGIARWRR